MTPDLYLKSLQIRNIATFDNQTIEFSPNFNAIVGETGSGKSLILDSLQLIFGSRADKKIVRKDCEYAMVEAIFHAGSGEIAKWLEGIGHPIESDEIVVKRIVYPNGPSKAWLNYQSCAVSMLGQFSRRYIDLVGQFENQKLLSSSYLLRLLDQFANQQGNIQLFTQDYQQWNLALKELANTKDGLLELLQQEDYIRFQIAEFEELSPSIEDEQELLQKKSLALNQEKHQKILSRSQARLSGDEGGSILNELTQLIKDLENFPLVDKNLLDGLSSAQSLLSEVDYALGSIDLDSLAEDELESVMDRLDKYQKLKRKFGGDLEKALESYSKLKTSKNNLDDLQKKISELEKDCTKKQGQLQAKAKVLHAKRVTTAGELSQSLTHAVHALNMSGATLKIDIVECELNSMGMSNLLFNAETNAGEGFFPVAQIASGGELSRILLALRQVLSSKDSISVFLFDEIDAGVGGETALKIGRSLEKVSKHSQVIAITHLPQIAVHAQHLVHVSKETIGRDKLRTHSRVEAIAAKDQRKFVESMAPLH